MLSPPPGSPRGSGPGMCPLLADVSAGSLWFCPRWTGMALLCQPGGTPQRLGLAPSSPRSGAGSHSLSHGARTGGGDEASCSSPGARGWAAVPPLASDSEDKAAEGTRCAHGCRRAAPPSPGQSSDPSLTGAERAVGPVGTSVTRARASARAGLPGDPNSGWNSLQTRGKPVGTGGLCTSASLGAAAV